MYRVEKKESVYQVLKHGVVIYYSNSLDAVINKLQQLHQLQQQGE